MGRVAAVLAALGLWACSGGGGTGSADGAVPDTGAAVGGGQSDGAASDGAALEAGPGDAGALADAAAPDAAVAPLPSAGCARGARPAEGAHDLDVAGLARSYRVHAPPADDGRTPLPLVLMFHGGGGSGRQFEQASSRMDAVADAHDFFAVYPDGTGVLRTWNGVGCCGYAVENDVDDLGFVRALLDELAQTACIDLRRIYASGMSNGGIFSHRLGCELSERIAAIAPVAGTNLTLDCSPARPVPVLHIHGSADGHVPYDGGVGCGPSTADFSSVPDTLAGWEARNGCGTERATYLEQGDGRCTRALGCRDGADVVLCVVEGGGHNWPGGDPPADLVACPGNGGQSSSFSASEVAWRFFSEHALP
jgi:polyhydroxybutyrate depolymerase